jgi:energy-coupling factor transport system substrate-specific component
MGIVIGIFFALVALAVAFGWASALRRSPNLFHWTTRDIVLASALAVAVGILFVAWSWVYQFLKFIPSPFNTWMVGFWMIGGTLVPYVVRRPGAAFMGEMVAALVEAPLVPWGITTLVSGLVQGLPAEAAFALTGYRRWGLGVLMSAGALAALGGFLQEYYPYNIYEQVLTVQIINVVLRIVGGAVLGGALAKFTGDALAETGVLETMPVSDETASSAA